MPFTPEQHRAYRARLKEEGLCTECAKPAEEGYLMCREHRIKFTAKFAATRVKWLADGNKCYECGRSLNEIDTANAPKAPRCIWCSTNQVNRARMRRWRLENTS